MKFNAVLIEDNIVYSLVSYALLNMYKYFSVCYLYCKSLKLALLICILSMFMYILVQNTTYMYMKFD